MTEPIDPKEPLDPDHELDVENDEIIGRAFKRSMVVLGMVALVALVVFGVIIARQQGAPEEATLVVEAPREVLAGQDAERPPELPFVDITAQAGIDFVHENGATGEKLLPETMGAGAAFFDADNDGDADLLLINSTRWDDPRSASSAFYRNDGQGGFTDATREVGLETGFYGAGVAIGDVDADGWLDVYVTAVGANRLFMNRGGRFEDVTARAGVAGGDDTWSTSAAFFDADSDGDLDLFVGNYVRWSPEIDADVDYRLTGVGRAYGPPVNYEGAFSTLYRNDGDGSFTDVSAAAGIEIRNEATQVPVGKALGVVPIDLDDDQHLDLIVANDTVQNFLFHNQGDGTFEEVGVFFGLAYGRNGEATGAMGIDAGYYRNDEELGFAIGNFANEMTSLYMSQGEHTLFVDEAITDGVGAASRSFLTFGVLFLDLDLDGRLDLLQTNGHLENEIAKVDPSQSYEQASQVFWNAGPEARQTFVEVPLEQLGDLATPLVGRGSAYADIDGDGDLDVVLTQTGRRALLLRNDQQTGHHWLRVRLVGDAANAAAIGAWIELDLGGAVQQRQVMAARSYQSSSELPVTFGLGAATAVERLVVHWADGTVQEVPVEGVDREIVVSRAAGSRPES